VDALPGPAGVSEAVGCQTKVTKLLDEGEAFLGFAGERNWPILYHVATDPGEEFSGAEDYHRRSAGKPG
jgi:hypothetical protein